MDADEIEWAHYYALLCEYLRENKSVPNYIAGNGAALGEWVRKQRSKKSSMSPEHRECLESTKGWTWYAPSVLSHDNREAMWEYKYALLCKHVRVHSRMPRRDEIVDDVALGEWLHTQRRNRDLMSPERHSLLEEIEGWSWRTREVRVVRPLHANREAEWRRKRDLLCEYVRAHGRMPLQNYKTEDSTALGEWLHTQRRTKEKMKPERRALLESIAGWTWNGHPGCLAVVYNAEWERHYALLAEYASANGRPPVRAHVTGDGIELGKWVYKQKIYQYSLAPERRVYLEAIDGWKWRSAYSNRKDPWAYSMRLTPEWMSKYELLRQYIAEHGKPPHYRYKTPDGVALGRWANRQRGERYRNSTRHSMLEAIQGWSW